MILETGDLETVPIILANALVDDEFEWTVQVHLENFNYYSEGLLLYVDWQDCFIAPEDGEESEGVTIAWDLVRKIVVP